MKIVNSELMKEFYYGDKFQRIVKEITNAEYIDFEGMGYDEEDLNDIKYLDIDAEIELNDNQKVGLIIKGEVTDNLIVFTNDYNNKSIVYKIDTQEYLY